MTGIERLPIESLEFAPLRAIGIQRRTVAVQTMVEGVAITVAGTILGTGLGTATARYLDSILRSFPGLPASVSFFVPRPWGLALAASVLLLSGMVAGIYPALLASRAPIAATLRDEAT
jgi:ABC-type lipoprotein release transport system permease subunit